ncbi:MAG: glucose-1-phosphate adenylyltransferase [Candidatus Omnitrophica bacterium]|nr:glucose-1-phosphate adenylyltransferase [Candidatus Omnitrophota bacterium]
MRQILTFILAGGRGERLDPLTRDRAKPAVPFGGIYRIIDYTLSNCVNSGLRRIYVLTQYKSFSLQKHLLAGWDVVSNQLGEFIDVIPAQQRISSDWYRGTADAIYQNLYVVEDQEPDLILILAGDHIYKMDYREMIDLHKQKNADVTMAFVPMPKEMSKDLGVIDVDEDSFVHGFQEKPSKPQVMVNDPEKISASMGIYLFSRQALMEELKLDSQDITSSHDFGKNVIPQMIRRNKRVVAYGFVNEKGRARYWRDIGTRDAYYQSNMDLLNPESEYDLFDLSWPVRTLHQQFPPIKVMNARGNVSRVIDSMISGGCVIEGGRLQRTILSSNVKVNHGAEIENSIIFEGAVIGEDARIKNAIIDKEVIIPAGVAIGYDPKEDRKHFILTTSGIVIVPKRTKIDA